MTQLYFASQLRDFGTTQVGSLANSKCRPDWRGGARSQLDPIPGATIPNARLPHRRLGAKTDEASKVHTNLISMKYAGTLI